MHKMKFTQRVEIFNLIKSVGKINEGYWEYIDEWNDKRVADQFRVSVTSVAGIRKELGNLRAAHDHLIGPRMARLEETVDRLEKTVNELASRLNKLQLREHFNALEKHAR
jgi:hypothetical protein